MIPCIRHPAHQRAGPPLPRVSALVPCFNQGHLLPRALDALLEGDVQPREILVIDDGSTDDTWSVIQEFEDQYPWVIRGLHNETNLGQHRSLWRALLEASGDYIYCGAADDRVLPGFMEKSMRLLAEHPQAGLCCTGSCWRDVGTGLVWHVGGRMCDRPAYLSPQAMVRLGRQGRLFIPTNSVIIKRSGMIEAGGFLSELKATSDWFTAYVVGFRFGICVVPEVLAMAEMHPEGYWRRMRRDGLAYRHVLEKVMCFLTNVRHSGDAGELIREAGSLYIHGWPMIWVLLKHAEYRRFATWNFLRKALWHATKVCLKKVTPTRLGNLYLEICGN